MFEVTRLLVFVAAVFCFKVVVLGSFMCLVAGEYDEKHLQKYLRVILFLVMIAALLTTVIQLVGT